jgi:hypothetical protein
MTLFSTYTFSSFKSGRGKSGHISLCKSAALVNNVNVADMILYFIGTYKDDIDQAESMAERIRVELFMKSAVTNYSFMPIPSRVELHEANLLDDYSAYFYNRLADYYPIFPNTLINTGLGLEN